MVKLFYFSTALPCLVVLLGQRILWLATHHHIIFQMATCATLKPENPQNKQKLNAAARVAHFFFVSPRFAFDLWDLIMATNNSIRDAKANTATSVHTK